MKRLPLIILLVIQGCGSEKEPRPHIEPTRPVSLYMTPDIVLNSLADHACYANCVVARVDQDNYLCWGKEWHRMADLLNVGEVMYCNR